MKSFKNTLKIYLKNLRKKYETPSKNTKNVKIKMNNVMMFMNENDHHHDHVGDDIT